MIISRKHSYVFVHVPKTGGTSMTLALEDRVGPQDILIGDTPKAKRRKGRLKDLACTGRLWKHSTLADVQGLYPPDAFVFTLVRNPWDRMVSYYHWLRDQSFDHSAVKLAKALSFAEFLKNDSIQNAVREGGYESFVRDAEGKDRCNLFARLEYPGDLEPLWDHLGFQLTIPHVNKSKRYRDWQTYYDAQSIDIISEIAWRDIQRFGYDTVL